MERFLENPHLAEEGGEDHELFKWVRRRESGTGVATSVPPVFEPRFGFAIAPLIDDGKAEIYCNTCRSTVASPDPHEEPLGPKGGWISDTYKCSAGHILFTRFIAHVLLR
jgi:hypothetical protein